MLKKLDFLTGAFLFLIIIFIYTGWVVRANIDNSSSTIIIDNDERFTTEGVLNLIKAPSIKEKINSTLYKAPQFGMLLVHVNYLPAVLPFKFWGEQGVIITIRMMQYLFMLIGYALLCLLFVRSWSLRALLFAVLLSLPAASFFAIQPKPEPEQYVLYALFLIFAFRKDFRFGWHWVFLGLAMGIKVSSLFIIAYFGFIALWADRKNWKTYGYYLSLIKAAVICLISFLLSEWTLLDLFISRRLDSLKVFFYFVSTQGNMSFNQITANIYNAARSFILKPDLTGSPAILNLSFLFLMALLVFTAVNKWKTWPKDDLLLKHIKLAFISIGAGVFLYLPILLFNSTRGNLYLYPMMFFVFPGLFCLIEQIIIFEKFSFKQIKTKVSGLLIALIFVMTVFALGKSHNYLDLQAKRTQSEYYLINQQQYQTVKRILKQLAVASNQMIRVFAFSDLWILEPTQYYVSQRFWTLPPLWEIQPLWRTGVEAIIIRKSQIPKPESPVHKEFNEVACPLDDFIGGRRCVYVIYSKDKGLIYKGSADNDLLMLMRFDIMAKFLNLVIKK